MQCNYCDIKHSKYISSYLSLVCLHSLDMLEQLLPGHATATPVPPEVTSATATPADESSPLAVAPSDVSISFIELLEDKYLGD